MKKRVLIVVQDISRAQEHEWFVEYIDRKRFDFHFLLINGRNTVMESFLHSHQVPVHHLSYSGKKDLPGLILSIRKLLSAEKFSIIHTHLFEATLSGMIAARLAGIKGRIYTRHHSDYHHVYYPKAVKYDKFNNFMANRIVAISKNVEQILTQRENVPGEKIRLIHHGIDMTDYGPGAVSSERISSLRKKYRLDGVRPVIGCISRFTEWKGIQFLIPAFQKLLSHFPNAVLVLANAAGNYEKQIKEMLTQLNPENYRLIQFENDVSALYKTFDCFVHVPIDASAEAFGQTYIESLASRIPSVFTISGIAAEFIVDSKNAVVVPYKDPDSIYNAVKKILEQPDFSERIVEGGYESVKNNFDIHIKIKKLEQLYDEF